MIFCLKFTYCEESTEIMYVTTDFSTRCMGRTYLKKCFNLNTSDSVSCLHLIREIVCVKDIALEFVTIGRHYLVSYYYANNLFTSYFEEKHEQRNFWKCVAAYAHVTRTFWSSHPICKRSKIYFCTVGRVFLIKCTFETGQSPYGF